MQRRKSFLRLNRIKKSRANFSPKPSWTLASELRHLRETGKSYVFGADDLGRDLVRDVLLDQNTSVEDIAYFVDAIISTYDSQRKRIEKGLEFFLEGDFTESRRITLGLITGAFEIGDVKDQDAPCHLLKSLDFTV